VIFRHRISLGLYFQDGATLCCSQIFIIDGIPAPQMLGKKSPFQSILSPPFSRDYP
jgi:hypothetical protein